MPGPDDYTYGPLDASTDDASPPDGSLPDGCVATTYYRDTDGDDFGSEETMVACDTAPDGWVATRGDCDDTEAAVFPGAAERCDGIDDDCDGLFDEGLMPRAAYYRDADGDGAGVGADTVDACMTPVGFSDTAGDCEPDNASVFPGATETCNGADDDCDGTTDEGQFGPRGASSTISGDVTSEFLRTTATGTGYALVWRRNSDRRAMLTILDPDGVRTFEGRLSSDDSAPREDGPDVALVSTGLGDRLVASWHGSSSVFARVFQTDGTAVGAQFVIGTAGGDQRATRAVTVGDRALVAWYSTRDVRARLVDPVGSLPSGVELVESFSTAVVPLGGVLSALARPALSVNAAGSEALIGMVAQLPGDTNAAAYIARIATGASPSWISASARDAPYPSIYYVGFSGPATAAGETAALVYGDAGGITSGCIAHAAFPSGGSAPTLDTCMATSGVVHGGARRGTVYTLALGHSGSRVGIQDVPVRGSAATGGSILDAGVTDVLASMIATTPDGTGGMLMYTVGTASPVTLSARPLGCE